MTALGRYGNRHLQQAVVFTFAGRIVAVLWAALDELDAHFVMFKLHQKPEEQNTLNIKLHHEGRLNNFTMKLESSYSSEMSRLIGSFSETEALTRWSLVIISIR